MHPALTTATLADLRRPRRHPAVSILMPTHRREPDNVQDPVRLRTLVAEAKRRLQADSSVSRADLIDVTARLERTAAEIDLAHAEDGLALFVAPGEQHAWTLARSVPDRVVLADTFLTRNLIAAQSAERPSWVLAVAADHASLWSAGPDHVTEETAGAFPLTRSLEDPDAERKERIGDLPSTFTDEQTRQFLREADAATAAVLDADPRPLYLIGEAAALAMLEEVGTVAGKAEARVVRGGLAQGPAQAVLDAVRPAVEARADEQVATVIQELDRARGRQEFAAGIDEVWQNVSAGRAGLVAVEDGFQATVQDNGRHLLPAEPGDPGARDDIVDEIVEKALDTGARVRFVPDGTLSDADRIAAVLRY